MLIFSCVLTGKLNRGISVVDTVEIIKGSKLTEEEYRKAAILGWCIELVSTRPALYKISKIWENLLLTMIVFLSYKLTSS